MRVVLPSATEDLMLDAVRAAFDGGSMRFYDGSPPVGPNVRPSDQQHLAMLQFREATIDVGQIRAALDDGLTINSGATTWARCFDRDERAILDCDIGETGTDAAITLNTASFRKGGPVVIRSFSLGVRR